MPTFRGRLKVFISSTCYDLLDLRFELRQFLEENGMSISLSEDKDSSFTVDPLKDSIESCLNNVTNSDVIICIIDRRYGGLIKISDEEFKSATHLEIEKARELRIPIFFFIRSLAWQDFQQLRDDDQYSSKWVEPYSKKSTDKKLKKRGEDQKQRWFKLMKGVASLKKGEPFSNWCDEFKSSVDLKGLVLKRILDHFPEYVGATALQPDHLVRIYFQLKKSERDGVVSGHFRNIGIGPALDILHGYRIVEETSKKDKGRKLKVDTRGGLGEKENIMWQDGSEYRYELPKNKQPVLFCEYSNRFGERYRVEVKLAWTEEGYIITSEDFFPLGRGESII